jgi:Domain of unknown function (DUF5664)
MSMFSRPADQAERELRRARALRDSEAALSAGDASVADVARLKEAGLYREAIPVLPHLDQLEGRKDDQGKTRIELFPGDALYAISQVLTFGAKKYADRNWEKGMSWGRVFGALQRHLWAWWQGRGPTNKSFLFGELDTETEMSHLWHAGCCIVFLIAYEMRGAGADDRPST